MRPSSSQPHHPHRDKQPCAICHSHHNPNRKTDRCYTLCAYCHSMHLLRDLVCGRCPKMEPHAQQEQQKSALHCPDCKGEGSYEKIVQTTVSETRQHYQRRLKQWLEGELKEGRPAEAITAEEWPLRKILKKASKTEEVTCKRCSGQGQILRLLECCHSNTCKDCNGDGFLLNPEWTRLRMQGVEHPANQEPVQCSICISSVQRGEKKLNMECGHIFHPACILKWLLIQEKCPVCRQVDPFIDSAQLQQAQRPPRLDRMQLSGRIQHRDVQRRAGMEAEPMSFMWRRVGMGMEQEVPLEWQVGRQRNQLDDSLGMPQESEQPSSEQPSNHSFTLTDDVWMDESMNLHEQDELDW